MGSRLVFTNELRVFLDQRWKTASQQSVYDHPVSLIRHGDTVILRRIEDGSAASGSHADNGSSTGAEAVLSKIAST